MNSYRVTITTGKLKGKSKIVFASNKRSAIEFILLKFPSNQQPMCSAIEIKPVVGMAVR